MFRIIIGLLPMMALGVLSHPTDQLTESEALAKHVLSVYNSGSETKFDLFKVVAVHRANPTDQSSDVIIDMKVTPQDCGHCQTELCRFTVGGGSVVKGVCGRPGGFDPVPTDNPQVQEAADYAVLDLNRRSNCVYQYKLVSVDHAQMKVVDGYDYLLNITTCMYRPADLSWMTEPCQAIHPEIIQHCDVSVVVHPWEDQRSVMTDFKCTGCA